MDVFLPTKSVQEMLIISTISIALLMVLLPICTDAGRGPDWWVWETVVKIIGLAIILAGLWVPFTASAVLVTIGMAAIVSAEAIYRNSLQRDR